jgi:hypothetical protein
MASLSTAPPPGSAEELRQFRRLQRRLPTMYARIFNDRQIPRTVVVVPSLSLDQEVLAKVSGIHFYEERLLCLLMLLQLPRTRVVYITSQPIHPAIIDYYLSLLPGVPGDHARRRLTLINCHDGSPRALTEKILARPRLVQRIRAGIRNPESAHLTCFNATPLERTLAVRLNIPLYACDPALAGLGSKSEGRKLFRMAGIPIPPGEEDLRSRADIARALAHLKQVNPDLKRAVVKLDDGFSGEGNAIFPFDAPDEDEHDQAGNTAQSIERALPHRLRFEATSERWDRYQAKFGEMGGIVEAFIEGYRKRSPSVQCRIDPMGDVEVLSTHDQLLGGPFGQVFLGCTFPADAAYRTEISEMGRRVGELLRDRGALGRFSIDFVSVFDGECWHHYAIEINLRMGGTTHPYLMLQFLTGGAYDVASGLYRTPAGQPRYYYATDNLHHAHYAGLTPDDLIDIAVYNELHFNGTTQQGVAFHLLGALSQFGKLGVLAVGDTPGNAIALYRATVALLDEETTAHHSDMDGSLSIP